MVQIGQSPEHQTLQELKANLERSESVVIEKKICNALESDKLQVKYAEGSVLYEESVGNNPLSFVYNPEFQQRKKYIQRELEGEGVWASDEPVTGLNV